MLRVQVEYLFDLLAKFLDLANIYRLVWRTQSCILLSQLFSNNWIWSFTTQVMMIVVSTEIVSSLLRKGGPTELE